MASVKEMEHVGETKCMANHDHDMVHELNKRLDSVWRYDQYIANAEGHGDLQNFWRKMKKQDKEAIDELRGLIGSEIEKGCF